MHLKVFAIFIRNIDIETVKQAFTNCLSFQEEKRRECGF